MATADISLLQQLECPVCFNYCTAPIYQCINGHNLCAECRHKITECGICRAPMSNTRNRFAESISAKITPPVPGLSYAPPPPFGYKPYKCYVSVREDKQHYFREQCQWQGSLVELLPHVLTCHPGCGDYGDRMDLSCSLNFELRSGTVYPKMLSFDRQLFWCMLYYFPETQLLHLYVKRVGDCAERYMSEFTLEIGGKELVYRQAVLAIDDDIRVGNKTLQLTRGMVSTFTDGAGRFSCKVRLIKEELSSAPAWMGGGDFSPHLGETMWAKGKLN